MRKPVVITDGLWWSTTHKLPELILDSVNHIYSAGLQVKFSDGIGVGVGNFEYCKSLDSHRWYVNGRIRHLSEITHWREIPK